MVWTYDAAANNGNEKNGNGGSGNGGSGNGGSGNGGSGNGGSGNQGRRVEVHAFQPLDGDRIMIAESGPARIIEIDRAGKLLSEVRLKVLHPNPHTDTRLVRKLKTGNYLVCHEGDGTVREYTPSGEIVWEYEVPLFGQQPKAGHGPEAFGNKVFDAVRLAGAIRCWLRAMGTALLKSRPPRKLSGRSTSTICPESRWLGLPRWKCCRAAIT